MVMESKNSIIDPWVKRINLSQPEDVQGKIKELGNNLKNKEALVFDYTGKTIVPSFVELYTNVGLPKLNFKEGGFPGTVGTDKAIAITGGKLDVDVFENSPFAIG